MSETSQSSPHDRWVRDGLCPAVHWTKAWCNGDADHAGDHWAPYLHPDGTTTPMYWPRGAG